MNHSDARTSKSEERFFKKIKKMTPEDGIKYTLKKLCRDTCRSWLYDKIDGELDCPMCGISQQKRIEDGMCHGLHNSHVGLGFAKMLDNVLSTFLMSHDYTQNPYNESVGIVKSKFIELHTNALNSKKCAIQVSCSKCNPKIEKCTVAEIEIWKLRGKDAWKEAKYQCSPNRTNSRLDIRDYYVQSDSSSDDDTSMGPEYAMNNVGSRLNLQQTMRQQFNSSSDGDTPDNTSETPLSDSPGSKRQRVGSESEEESHQNKKLRRSCVGRPDYSHNGQNLSKCLSKVKRLSKDKIDVEPAETHFSRWKTKLGVEYDNTTEEWGCKTRPICHEKCAKVWDSYEKFSANLDNKHRFNKSTFQNVMKERGFVRVQSVHGNSCGYKGHDWYYTNLKVTGSPL
jgi:hypothetical protein